MDRDRQWVKDKIYHPLRLRHGGTETRRRLTTEVTEDVEVRLLESVCGVLPQTDSSNIFLFLLTSAPSVTSVVNLLFSFLRAPVSQAQRVVNFFSKTQISTTSEVLRD